MAIEDQEKTSFISLEANYHCIVMPFGLKNARVIYHRIMTQMFRKKIRNTVEVYIDDMVVKSKENQRHAGDLTEILRRHRLHLNADKCVFGVGAGKFLGYMITHQGIEVNPDLISAMVAALNRFVSKSADCCRPFYQLLKK